MKCYLSLLCPYGTTWRKVNGMCLSNRNLFISHAQGISKINLETCECRLVVELDDQPCVLTRFGTDVLYTNQKKASYGNTVIMVENCVCLHALTKKKEVMMAPSKKVALSSQ